MEWPLDRVSPGMKTRTINWAQYLDKSEASSQEWLLLVSLSKRFVDAWRDNPVFQSLDDTTVYQYSLRLLDLMRWMFRSNYLDFSCLDASVIGYYVEDIIEDKLEIADDGSSISHGTLSNYLDILILLHQYGRLFIGFPEMVIPEAPFEGRSASQLADEYIDFVARHSPALPVPVYNAIIRTGTAWLDELIDPILDIQHAFLRGREDAAHIKSNSHSWYTDRRVREVLPVNGGVKTGHGAEQKSATVASA